MGRRFSARARGTAAFTLVEVVIAALIVGLVFGGIINCYIQSGMRVQWTGYSLAAQNLAMEVLEQAKAARWDPTSGQNQLLSMNLTATNYNSGTSTYTGRSTGILDVPYAGTNFTLATNYVTVQLISGVGNQTNVAVEFVRVDTVWPFFMRSTNLLFTNTVATIMSPDDRQF